MTARPAPFWAPPEPALAIAAADGEWTVARVRLLAMALLLVSPTIKIIRAPDVPINAWGFGITVLAALAALVVAWILRTRPWHPAIGFASSALDASLVTTALASFALVSSPLDAVNSKVTFEMYFLAIAATSLRYDPRICLAIGALAVAQYGGLWLVLAALYDLRDPALVTDSGSYVALDQVTRLILLGVAVVLSTTLVRRAQRLQDVSTRDRLTGLHNRLHFERALEVEIARAMRYDHPLALAILDVDHFKAINDAYGHAAGDRVLRALSARLAGSLRRTDVVARHGGEEFVILMTETTSAQATERIEQVRRAIVAEPTAFEGERSIAIDFSAGVAGMRGRDDRMGAATLLDRADARLLAAKRAGRGRTIGDAADESTDPVREQPDGAD
ncbi:MAG: GGDEF domain-containing protein [Vicinamibacterales bacterium]